MPKRLATLTLPGLDNNRQSLAFVHDALRIELLNHFGGYTAVPCVGAWRDANGRTFRDENIRYEVACDVVSNYDYRQLVQLARSYGGLGRQDAIFLTDPNGNVEIITLSPGRTPADDQAGSQPSPDAAPSANATEPQTQPVDPWLHAEAIDNAFG